MTDCLVIIDIQYGFLINKETKEIPYKVRNLLKEKSFDHIVATKFLNKENSPFERFMDWHDVMEDEIHPEILKVAEKTFDKNLYTCFNEEFEKYIKDNNIDKLYFIGVDTDACVLKSAIDCFERNIDFEVLVDFCASSGGEEYHNAAIKVLERTIGEKCIKRLDK